MKTDIKELVKERGSRLKKLKEEQNKKDPYISTGVTLLDLSFGGGDVIAKGGMGIKIGDMVNIYGDTGAGKSFLFNEIIASAKRTVESGALLDHGIKKFDWYYADFEQADNFDSEGLYGFEIHPEGKEKVANTVEDCCYHIQSKINKLKEDELFIYVVDSLDALTSRKQKAMNDEELKAFEKGKKIDKGSYDMDKAKFLAQKFFAPIAEAKENKNVIILVVSQLRQKVNATMFEKKDTTSGTQTMKFYFDTRMQLLPTHKYFEDISYEETGEVYTREVGGNVRLRPDKVRHSRPNRLVQFDFIYTYGLDNVGSNIDFLYGLRDERHKLKTGEAYNNLQFPPQPLGKTYDKPNLTNLRAWLKELLPDAGVKTTTPKDTLTDLISENNLREAYLEKFGSGLNRQGLIDYIVDNDLEEALEKAVINKWESIEGQIAKPHRKRKW